MGHEFRRFMALEGYLVLQGEQEFQRMHPHDGLNGYYCLHRVSENQRKQNRQVHVCLADLAPVDVQ